MSKSIGIALGIALANCVQSSTNLTLTSFAVVTWIHMYCNLKSYQSIQLRTLNPYRAGITPFSFILYYSIDILRKFSDKFSIVEIVKRCPEMVLVCSKCSFSGPSII